MRPVKLLLFVLFLSATALSQTPQEKVQAMADLFVKAYNAREYSKIDAQFNARMTDAVPPAKMKEFMDNCHRDLGAIVKLGGPVFVAPSAATFPAEFEKTKMEIMIALDDEGKIAGFQIKAPVAVKPKNTSRNKTPLRLPFNGDWFIFWGGDTVAQNYHQDAATQRFAFDILKVNADGQTHSGNGAKNEDYFAFGQEIVADADGVVTDVVTGVHDNSPGVMNPLMAVGNFVMIKHANGEVSVYCHLKFESTRVKAGQPVKRGDVIGLCGNTGNSTEPHLHYQVQGTSLFEAENSMKVFFEKVMLKRDGKTEEKSEYSPVKGDIVSETGKLF